MTIKELIELLNKVENKNREVYLYDSFYEDVVGYSEYSIDSLATIWLENVDAPRYGIAIKKEN